MASVESGSITSMLLQKPLPPKVDVEPSLSSEVKSFSQRDREALREKGYSFIYNLTGGSIVSMVNNPIYRQKFCLNEYFLEYLKHEAPTSPIQVAINPTKLIIQESNHKNLREQAELIDRVTDEVGIQGIKAIMGSASHNIKLFINHWEETGEHLLGNKYNNLFARTNTRINKNKFISVGHFKESKGDNNGLHLRFDPPSEHPYIIAVPMLIKV